MSAAEARAQATFTALLWALSHPGRVRELPQGPPALPGRPDTAAFAAIAECLLDLETSYFCPDVDLDRRLMLTGARPVSPQAAQYQFYPTLHDADLAVLRAAPAGSYLYPDDGATLVLGCKLGPARQGLRPFGAGRRLILSGPGIREQHELLIDGVPEALWPLRREGIRYPQGWDVFLVDGASVLGLPRTTAVEVR